MAGRKPPPIRDARAAISRGAAPALAPAPRAASSPARTVASIMEFMNRVTISSSSGVKFAMAAPMWRASGRNIAPPSR